MLRGLGLRLLALSFAALAQPAWAIPITIVETVDVTGGYIARTGGGLGTYDDDSLVTASFAQFDGSLGELLTVEIGFAGHLGDPPGGIPGSALAFTVRPQAELVLLSVSFVMHSMFGPVMVDETASAYSRNTAGDVCHPDFPETSCRDSVSLPDADALLTALFGSADAAQLLAFTGTGLFDVDVGTHTFLSCNGCSSAQANAHMSGVVSVAYTYESSDPVSVPEPSSAALLSLGLAFLAGVRRKTHDLTRDPAAI